MVSRPLLFTLLLASLCVSGASFALLAHPEPLPAGVSLPEVERRYLEFLLLLPVAALVCVFVRNVLGVHTFGTFAPALLGLAFREMRSLLGVFLLVTVLSIGWIVRRGLGRLNLLQVPRSAVMLSVIVLLLAGFVIWSNHAGQPVAEAVPLLPMVIVTGLIERFWTAEEEDGTGLALRTMACTMSTALAVWLITQSAWIGTIVVEYPATLLYVLAAQLLLGRYTGYRLTELARFRDLA